VAWHRESFIASVRFPTHELWSQFRGRPFKTHLEPSLCNSMTGCGDNRGTESELTSLNPFLGGEQFEPVIAQTEGFSSAQLRETHILSLRREIR
jgi:hypothetical protein